MTTLSRLALLGSALTLALAGCGPGAPGTDMNGGTAVDLSAPADLAPAARHDLAQQHTDDLAHRPVADLAQTIVNDLATPPDLTVDAPPHLVNTTPASGATGVPVGAPILLTFDKAMRPAPFTVTLSPSIAVTTQWSADARTATVRPMGNLMLGTTYTVVVSGSDLAGTALGVTSFSFATQADTVAPVIVATTPAGGATGVALDGALSVTFSKAMNKPSVSVTVTSFSFALGGASWSADAKTVTLAHAPFPYNQPFTLSVAGSDSVGNALGGTTTFSFTTVPEPAPSVVSTTPAANATGVVPGSQIVIRFSEAMRTDPITPAQISSAGLCASWTWSADATSVSCVPVGEGLGTRYLFSVATNLVSAHGTALSSVYLFAFTIQRRTTVAATPGSGATNVDFLTPLQLTFSMATQQNGSITVSTLDDFNNTKSIASTLLWTDPQHATVAPPAGAWGWLQTPEATVLRVTWTLSGVVDTNGNPVAITTATFTTTKMVHDTITLPQPPTSNAQDTDNASIEETSQFFWAPNALLVGMNVGNQKFEDRSWVSFPLSSVPATFQKLYQATLIMRGTAFNDPAALGPLVTDDVLVTLDGVTQDNYNAIHGAATRTPSSSGAWANSAYTSDETTAVAGDITSGNGKAQFVVRAQTPNRALPGTVQLQLNTYNSPQPPQLDLWLTQSN